MTLEELARAAPFAKPLAVPAWTLGCFRRRCITYATGAEDASTEVIWVQSHGLTGDLRISAKRPDVSSHNGFAECTREELVALAASEGGVGETSFTGGRMYWNNWAAFQPYDKWPEPGELRRVGNALMEFAPSGIYIEDWRLQPESSGPLIGLRLVSETRNGIETKRDGGLVIAGVHAIFALARRNELTSSQPVQTQMADAAEPHLFAKQAFDAVASYLRFDGHWLVRRSTDPFIEGKAQAITEGFERVGQDMLVQNVIENGEAIRRLWRVDTLLTGQEIPLATQAGLEGQAWLARESATLLSR
jgi:hypothetical protein